MDKRNPRILVVGSTGYLGRCIVKQATSKYDIIGTSTAGVGADLRFDLARPFEFDYKLINPSDVILLTAAISSPDVCAKQFEYAWSVNVSGTVEFIDNVISCGGRVVFFSSDTVYGEKDSHFDESADCIPAGEYAAMKHEVECRFAGNPSFKSIRLSYVFSREDKFTEYLARCVRRDEKVELFHPFYRAVVHRDDVVEGVLALAGRWDGFSQQIINFGGPEILSRIEFAQCLHRYAMPGLRYCVTKPDSGFFKNRPRVIAMKSPVLPDLLGRSVRTLAEAVKIEFGKQ